MNVQSPQLVNLTREIGTAASRRRSFCSYVSWLPNALLCLSVALVTAWLAPPVARGAEAGAGLNEVPLSKLLEVMVVDRGLLAFDARSGGQIHEPLRLDERVIWQGSKGEVGAVLTDQRVLAVGVGSSAWRAVELQIGEESPREAMLGDRVVLVVTNRRALGFGGQPIRLSEQALGIHEVVLAKRIGENTGALVTDRRALGLSPHQPGFSEIKLWIREKIESGTAAANLATVRSDRRILIFRSSTRSWEERRLDLPTKTSVPNESR